MANGVGGLSVDLRLEDSAFLAGLEAARASLEDFAAEVGALTVDAAGGAGAATSLRAVTGEALAAGAASAFAAGEELALSYAGGVAAAGAEAASDARAMADAAVAAAGSGVSGASAIGSSFAAGLAAGISAGRSGVVAAAASVAKAAAAAARSALAIHSPSRVTREFGEFFDLGFIRGVEGMAPDIREAVREAVYVEPPAGAAWGSGRELTPIVRVSGPGIDYEALREALDARPVVLTMDNRRVASIQARETARAQSLRNRSIALGYGR